MGIYLTIGILGLIGTVMLAYAIKRLIQTLVFIKAANRTLGRVVRLATSSGGDGQTMYLPVLEFQAGDGRRIEYKATVASNPPAYQPGETAEILFLRKNPHQAKIKSFSELWLVTMVIAIASLACFGIVGLIYLGIR